MAVVRTTLCALFMVTVALSKPVSLSEDDDSSKSSESTELSSSEETAANAATAQEPVQPASEETELPNEMEETDPPGSTALPSSAWPSLATLDISALPDLEDPQTSADTDPVNFTPDDPSQTTLGVDVSQDMPEADPAQDPIGTGAEHVLPETLEPERPRTDLIIGADGTNQPQVTTTKYQGFPKGATPPFPPYVVKSPSSTAPPVSIPIGTTITGVPVCFTFEFVTPEPDPPRGDSI